MSTRVVDRVDDWESQSFTGGYRELGDLADEEFSGVVRAGGAELYMTKGVAVGIRRGDLEDFEDATGTAYRAPSPALPLLAVMQDNSDEVRDKFYSEKTAISEVDRTLSDGNFTGYIELAENVLSGDYYLVYHAGESMSVGFVGESRRLIDGDEAFRTADDEVGIYEVRPAEVEPIELPEPSEPASDSEPAVAGSDDGPQADEEPQTADRSDGEAPSDDGSHEASPADDRSAEGAQTESRQGGQVQADDAPTGQDESAQGAQARKPETEDGEGSRTSSSGDVTPESTERENAPQETEATVTEETPARDREARTQQGQHVRSRQQDSPRPDHPTDTGSDSDGQYRDRPEQPATTSRPRPHQGDTEQTRPEQASAGQQSREGQRESPQAKQAPRARKPSSAEGDLDLETRAIPSLDPARTKLPERREPHSSTERTEPAHQHPQQSQQPRQSGTQQSGARQSGQPSEGSTQQETASSTADAGGATEQPAGTVDTERIETLEGELDDREAELDRLEMELESTRDERDELQEQLETVGAERDDLEAEIERLEDQLRQLETELGAATDAERRLTASEALTGTDVFIRYYSKGDATLEKAHAGSGRREDVNENLRLENHTQFEKHAVSIGGKTYDEFLDGRLEYQFVEWLVRDLLFEIRETGHDKQLRDLYDVLPQLDRAELAGVVDVTYTEDGQETRTQESFDVILRDRMGSPLLVANLNDSREAATGSMMERLITSAERVGQSSEEFAGAFLVTSSFFDPEALEIASEATQGGLLTRDKRTSFVNLTRKRGYHLCLVEARNRNFHLAVPEL